MTQPTRTPSNADSSGRNDRPAGSGRRRHRRRRPAQPQPAEAATRPRSHFALWIEQVRDFLKDRFTLSEDCAEQEETVEVVRRGVEFRGVNLWVLIFATMIASLGLNVNSAAVIIGAMLVSPLMGPIIGMGLSVGINDFELLKRSFRNFSLMTIVSILTSTLYFFISPISTAQSELLARTMPTTYDVLIAFFGGLAGIVAQSRKDRTSTVIPGVAIATALMPPLCTAGFGLATGQFRYFMGAFYLFLINTVFIAMATYIIVRALKYRKKQFLDKRRERFVRRVMMCITLVTFIPSVIVGLRIVRETLFETAAKRYVEQVFNFRHTRVIEANTTYKHGKTPSSIELVLLGESLGEEVVENARAQLYNYGLEDVELLVRQADTGDKVDLKSLQQSYSELLTEKNGQIEELRQRLSRYKMEDIEFDDISREAGAVVPGIDRITVSKSLSYDVRGQVRDTLLICVVKPSGELSPEEAERLRSWLQVRTRIANVRMYTE